MGIRIMSDNALERAPGPPAWFSGVLIVGYHQYLDGSFNQPRIAERLWTELDAVATRAQQCGGCVTLFSHPTMVTCSTFWDDFNFRHGR